MAESLEELDRHVRTCIGIFVALLGLTLVTVAVSYLELSVPATISVALCIALVKGSMVVSFFMHLISEKRLVFWSLALTVIFFLLLMVLPIATDQDIVTQEIEIRH